MTFFKNNKLEITCIVFLFAIHVIIGNIFIIEFPPFGDDLGFIDFVRIQSQKAFSFKEFYYPFNGGVHSNLLMKLVLLAQYKLFGVINYKTITIFLQLILLPIAFIFLSYFSLNNWSKFSKISFFLFFFSLKGNLDNFNVIGILQHGAALFFCFVWTAYLSVVKRNFILAFLVANLALIFISSEAIGMILILIFISFFNKFNFRFGLILFSIVNIILFYCGIKYSTSILELPPAKIYFFSTFFKGFLIFLGGLFTNLKVAFTLGSCYLLAMIFTFLKLPGSFKEKLANLKMFPVLIFVSLAFVGLLIQFTRVDFEGANHSFGTSVAIRFSSYHLYSILLFLFFLLERSNRYLQISLLSIAIFFYGFNLVRNYDYLKNERERIYLDAFNFSHVNENTIYEVNKNQNKNIMESGIMILPNFDKLRNLKSVGEFKVMGKKQENEFTYLETDRSFDSTIAKIYLENSDFVLVSLTKASGNKSLLKVSTKFLDRHKIDKIEVLK